MNQSQEALTKLHTAATLEYFFNKALEFTKGATLAQSYLQQMDFHKDNDHNFKEPPHLQQQYLNKSSMQLQHHHHQQQQQQHQYQNNLNNSNSLSYFHHGGKQQQQLQIKSTKTTSTISTTTPLKIASSTITTSTTSPIAFDKASMALTTGAASQEQNLYNNLHQQQQQQQQQQQTTQENHRHQQQDPLSSILSFEERSFYSNLNSYQNFIQNLNFNENSYQPSTPQPQPQPPPPPPLLPPNEHSTLTSFAVSLKIKSQQRQQQQQQFNQNLNQTKRLQTSKNYFNLINNYHQIDQQKEQQQQQQHHQQQQQQLQGELKHQLHHQQQDKNSNNLVDSLQKDVQKLTTNVSTTTTTLSSSFPNNNQTTNSYSIAPTDQKLQQLQQSKAQGDSITQKISSMTNQCDHHHHHHHHHQQQQQYGGISTSPFKSCMCFGETTYHMKILVPAVASGAIIGKGGETIATLQKDTGARVKMSKSHDFYPGTTERVCLITGTVEGIMTVLDFIMDKIREKPDLTTKLIESDAKQQDREKQVKILVPNSTAGMIIGKGGAYIKQIKEESGSYVQISQKPKDISLQERCITIIGDKDNNKNACKMILAKIVEDPQSGTCLNVSYADVNGPVANFNPTGSPYATNQNAINSSTASLNSNLGTAISGTAAAAGLLVNGTGINLSLNLGSPNPAPNLAVATQLLEHIKVAMRGSGYSDTATTEVCAALSVLAKYGILGIGVGVPHAANGAHTTLSSYLGVSALEQNAAQAATAGNVFGAVGQVNLEQYAAAAAAAAAASRPTQSQLEAAAAQFDPFRHLSSAAAQASTPVSLNNNSFGLTGTGTSSTAQQALNAASAAHSLTAAGLSKSPTPGDLSAKDSKNVEIPEVIVGAILGLNGRSLVEIQHASGANVQISKKGIFAPGTRNRIVTITGQPSAIAKAQFLIEQKINEEETKRARQIPLTTVVN